MGRDQPLVTTDVLGNFDAEPVEHVVDYMVSKQANAKILKPPNDDSPGDSIELLYLLNFREHEDMLRAQVAAQQRGVEQQFLNEKRKKRMYKGQAELRHHLIDVNLFIKECFEKGQTSMKVIEEELLRQQECAAAIAKQKVALEIFADFKKQLKGTVAEMEMYETVIQQAVQISPIFNSINDCTARSDALMLAQTDISNFSIEKIKEIKNMEASIKSITQYALLKILGLQNTLTESDRSYTVARNKSREWEILLSRGQGFVDMMNTNKMRTLDGVLLLAKLLIQRREDEVDLTRWNVGFNLDLIKSEFELLTEVVNQCNDDGTAGTAPVNRISRCL